MQGAGRGKQIGVPTLNLDLAGMPAGFAEGVYACAAWLDDNPMPLRGAMHYGPRPVFNDSVACEVYLLDGAPPAEVTMVKVEAIERLRGIENFPGPEALVEQIQEDVRRTDEILARESLRLGFKKSPV